MNSVLVMKPGKAGSELCLKLKTTGQVKTLYWPALTFSEPPDLDATVAYIEDAASTGAHLIVLSPTSVDYLYKVMPNLPPSAHLAAIGGQTAKHLRELYGSSLEVFSPPGGSVESGSEALFNLLKEKGLPKKVVLVGGQTGRDWLFKQFQQAGTDVGRAVLYNRIPFKASEKDHDDFMKYKPSVIYLTSTDSVNILLENLNENLQKMARRSLVVTIHPRIEKQLKEQGFGKVLLIESAREDIPDLLTRLARDFV